MQEKYKVIGCGGTFDLFHKGHRSFLRFGLRHAEKLLIGIASDGYAAGRKKHTIEPYGTRKQAVENFLNDEDAQGRFVILPLDSVYIPKEWENEPIDALLVTPESMPGAEEINKKRIQEGRRELVVIPAPLVYAQDGEVISSSRIRAGRIDREGVLWVKKEWNEQTLLLPTSLRNALRTPFGEIIDAAAYNFTEDESSHLIAVGDVTTMLLHERNIVPQLSVIDLIVEREQRFKNVEEMGLKTVSLTYSVQNTPGLISPEVFQRVHDAFMVIDRGKTVLLHVTGEEDLTVLPILLHAPLGWILCYGQPKEGTVKVIVTEEVKVRCREMLSNFTIR